MPKFLQTRGLPKLSIAICDRCRAKRPYSELRPDGNSPGLMVCVTPAGGKTCWDSLDPWKLPAPNTETINLTHARPDAPLQGESNVSDPYVQYD